jgi:predicted DNA-binding transcriptional regulator AlpA
MVAITKKKAPPARLLSRKDVLAPVAAARAAAKNKARAKSMRLMSRREVLELIPVSYPKIWAMMQRGEFPRSLAIGGKCVWREDEVHAWIDGLSKVKLKGDAP